MNPNIHRSLFNMASPQQTVGQSKTICRPMTIEEQKSLARITTRDEWNYLCSKPEFVQAVDTKSLMECIKLKEEILSRRIK